MEEKKVKRKDDVEYEIIFTSPRTVKYSKNKNA
jgi:hypothetical protein